MTAPQTAVSNPPRKESWLAPSLADFFIVVMLVLLFAASTGGWTGLLNDGDTGWHIRTGEWILRTHTVPRADPFSFSRPGAPWFAWEWLADVIFAAGYAQQGLKGVVLIAALLILSSILILFRYLLWRGAGIALALGLAILAADASQVHYLARPHLFTLVLMPVSLWLLEADRRRRRRAVWWLVPLAGLWANLHGGFLALIGVLGLWSAGRAAEDWAAGGRGKALAGFGRHALLTAACVAATLVNPFGYRLYTHVLPYVRSQWIARNVDEFQPPGFRSEGMLKFEALLLVGVGLAPLLIRRRRYADLLLVGVWAHLALHAVRHVPLYMIVAAPVAGTELALVAEAWAAGRRGSGWVRAAEEISAQYTALARRNSVWPAAVLALLWFTPAGQHWPRQFPARFPVETVERNLALLAPAAGPPPRLLSPDDWGGYLIYRLYPRGRVFMDGRSDFYGPDVGNDYICLMQGCPRWQQAMARWSFQAALLPPAWPLLRLLEQSPGWRVVDRGPTAVLLLKIQ